VTIPGDVKVYEIKWQLRATAYVAAALSFAFVAVNLRDDLAQGRWLVNLFFLAFGLLGLWHGTGVVFQKQSLITGE
jgi:hypothetical protein